MFRAVWLGLRNLVLSGRARQEHEQEIEGYFEAAVAGKIASGMSESEARRQTRLENGTPEAIADEVRTVTWESAIENRVRDVVFGWRVLRKNAAVSVVAVLTLALGLGATTAVYSVVRGVLLRPFPFPEQDRLLMMWQKGTDGKSSNVGFATFVDWRRLNRSFSSMSAVSFWTPTYVTAAESENLSGFRVTAGTFDMLGVRMALGRDFVREEDVPGKGTVVILTHQLWVREFGSDPEIVGKTVQFGSRIFTVVGVLPESMPSVFSFDPRKEADLYAPLAYDTTLSYACRTCQHLRVIGRLRPGVSEAQALAEMDQISHALVQQYPNEYAHAGVLFTRLHEYVVGDVRAVLTALLGAVSFVLLIACVNVSNLLVSSATQRRREFALRLSLGAQPRRLVQQMLTESMLLSVLGGLFGWALAWALLSIVLRMASATLPRSRDIHLDAGVFLFAFGICTLSSILFGLVPAFHARSVDPAEAMNDGARATTSRARLKLRNTLIACDVAVSLVLLVGAGLMTKSFLRLVHTDPGFDPNRVLTLSVSLWGERYSKDPPVVAFYNDALQRIAAVPGVSSAALTSQLPLGGNMDRYGVHVEGKMQPNPENDPSADRYSISTDYFRVLHIPLLRGRMFDASDSAESSRVAVVNELFANTFWPGEDPIGKRFRVGDVASEPRTVVGVVGNVLHRGLNAPATLQMYLPNRQMTDTDVVIVVRTRNANAVAMAADVRRAITSVDPQQPVSDVATMTDVVATSASRQRFSAFLFAGFALCGVVMAAVGIYGVIAYAVVQRTQEIGIRMAMGAQGRDVLAMIVKKGMRPALMGLGAGLLIALAATQLLSSLLFGVKPNDANTFLAMGGLMMAVAWLACYLPARRATRIDPVETLRAG